MSRVEIKGADGSTRTLDKMGWESLKEQLSERLTVQTADIGEILTDIHKSEDWRYDYETWKQFSEEFCGFSDETSHRHMRGYRVTQAIAKVNNRRVTKNQIDIFPHNVRQTESLSKLLPDEKALYDVWSECLKAVDDEDFGQPGTKLVVSAVKQRLKKAEPDSVTTSTTVEQTVTATSSTVQDAGQTVVVTQPAGSSSPSQPAVDQTKQVEQQEEADCPSEPDAPRLNKSGVSGLFNQLTTYLATCDDDEVEHVKRHLVQLSELLKDRLVIDSQNADESDDDEPFMLTSEPEPDRKMTTGRLVGAGKPPRTKPPEFLEQFEVFSKTYRGKKAPGPSFIEWWRTIADLRSRKEIGDPIAWLGRRIKQYSESWAGQQDESPQLVNWLKRQRFDDSEGAWDNPATRESETVEAMYEPVDKTDLSAIY